MADLHGAAVWLLTVALFFPLCGWLIFLCPVDERQRYVATTTTTTVVLPQQPQYAPAQPQYAPAQPQYAPAQPVYQQQQPVMAQPVVTQTAASAPPPY